MKNWAIEILKASPSMSVERIDFEGTYENAMQACLDLHNTGITRCASVHTRGQVQFWFKAGFGKWENRNTTGGGRSEVGKTTSNSSKI